LRIYLGIAANAFIGDVGHGWQYDGVDGCVVSMKLDGGRSDTETSGASGSLLTAVSRYLCECPIAQHPLSFLMPLQEIGSIERFAAIGKLAHEDAILSMVLSVSPTMQVE